MDQLLGQAESDPDHVTATDVETLVGSLAIADTDTSRRIANVLSVAATEQPSIVAEHTYDLIDGIDPSDESTSFSSSATAQLKSVLETLQAVADHDPTVLHGDLEHLLESMLNRGYELDFETPSYDVKYGIKTLALATSSLQADCIETLRQAVETGSQTRKRTALSLTIGICDTGDETSLQTECATMLADTLIPPESVAGTTANNNDRDHRRLAATGLASLTEFGGKVRLKADQLATALEDEDPIVRSETAWALGGTARRDPEAVVNVFPQLADCLDDETVQENSDLNSWIEGMAPGPVEFIR